MIEFTVPGKVIAKQRPRKGKNGFYTPQPTVDYEREVGWCAKIAANGQKLLTGPVSVKILIHVQPPKSWCAAYRKQAIDGLRFPKSGDIDNKIKSLLDGMNKIIYLDDSQVAHLSAKQRYAEEHGAVIQVSGFR